MARTIHVSKTFARTLAVEKADPSKAQPKRVAVFFDYDKTLIAKDSMSMEGHHVFIVKYMNTCYRILIVLWCLILELFKIPHYFPDFATRQYFLIYRGMSIKLLGEEYKKVYQRYVRPLIFEEMIQTLEEHRRQGHLVVLISASPTHLVLPFAEEVDADLWVCTDIESIQCPTSGSLVSTGSVVEEGVCCGKEKPKVMRQIAETYGVDLSESFAYSDHYDDIPMLETVKTATVINPTKALHQVAKKRDWSIRRPVISF